MRALWSIITQVTVGLYQASRVVIAALAGVRRVPGGIYDQATRQWGQWLVQLNGLHPTVEGLERIPAGRPCVFASNHLSWADVWLLAAVIPGTMRFVAKKELLRVPLFGQALKAAGHVLIDRRNITSSFSAYEEAAEAIRSGISATIFVEGTRSRDGRMKPFKRGPFVLAILAGAPIVPVLIEGTYAVMPTGSIGVRPGPIRITFGDPIPTDGLTHEDREALSERAREAMAGLATRDPSLRSG